MNVSINNDEDNDLLDTRIAKESIIKDLESLKNSIRGPKNNANHDMNASDDESSFSHSDKNVKQSAKTRFLDEVSSVDDTVNINKENSELTEDDIDYMTKKSNF